jgi:hypothetical protein
MAALLFLPACGKDPQYSKATYPVTGLVTVDGAPPGSPVKVHCHSANGIDTKDPTLSSALTDNEGRFHLSTYETGDGVPEGDYLLTFEWGQMNLISMRYGGPDKLKGRYKDPQKSEHKFSVTAQQEGPLDLGTIPLTTK